MRAISLIPASTLAAVSALAFLSACTQPAEPGVDESRLAAAGIEEPETLVIDCGTVIAKPGRYRLTHDLEACPDYGIAIRASGVTLRLAGHSLAGAPGAVTGIAVSSPLPSHRGLSQVAIEGPGTIERFGTGISFSHISASRVTATTIRSNQVGLRLEADATETEWLTSDSDSLVRDVVVGNARDGIDVRGARNGVLIDNRIEHNGFPGGGSGVALWSGTGFDFRRNRIQGNAWSGILINTFSHVGIVVGNLIVGNGTVDVVDANGPTGCWDPTNGRENIIGSYFCELD